MSQELLFKFHDDVPDGMQEHLQLFSGIKTVKRLNVFEQYLEGKVRLESRLFGVYSPIGFDLEPQEFILTAQKVTGVNSFSGNNSAWWNGGNPEFQSGGNSRNDTQSSVPIESSQVMNTLQTGTQTSFRIVDRFHSRVGLYGLKPIRKLLREWVFEETTLLEICGVPIKDGKLHSICVGGRLGSFLLEGDCIPNQPIESRTKLISVLAQFEREFVLSDALNDAIGKRNSSDVPPAVFVISADGGNAVIAKNSTQFRIECDEVICCPV
jgi:hypothetical protein